MTKSDILITGLGVISAAGANLAESLAGLRRGERHAGAVSLFPTTMQYPVFEVKEIPRQYQLQGMRTLSLALVAADQALADAGLTDLSGLRVGICLGTTVASQLNDLQFYRTYREKGSAPMEPVDRFLKGNLAQYLARHLKARGPALTVVNACSSGTDAVGVALSWLRGDLCDIVIAGGADELNHVPYCGFASLGILNPGLCAPFDRDRKGLNLGEGAGIMILESQSSAQKRGASADLYAAGYGSMCDGYHLTAPSPDGAGLKASLLAALGEAGITPAQIAFVNAHGTGTQDNDLVEGKVLAELCGPGLKVLSTKGFTGHTLGAAGGIEAVFAAAALREGWLPASPGFLNQDPAIPLAPLGEPCNIQGDYAVSTSLAFGGNNSAVVIGKVVAS